MGMSNQMNIEFPRNYTLWSVVNPVLGLHTWSYCNKSNNIVQQQPFQCHHLYSIQRKSKFNKQQFRLVFVFGFTLRRKEKKKKKTCTESINDDSSRKFSFVLINCNSCLQRFGVSFVNSWVLGLWGIFWLLEYYFIHFSFC